MWNQTLPVCLTTTPSLVHEAPVTVPVPPPPPPPPPPPGEPGGLPLTPPVPTGVMSSGRAAAIRAGVQYSRIRACSKASAEGAATAGMTTSGTTSSARHAASENGERRDINE